MSVLIVGVSTRAAAESAALAGFDVTSIDAFDDLDQHRSVQSIPLDQDFSCAASTRAATGLDCEAVVYLASFENHPGAVRRLSSGRTLWGNSPEVLQRVRDPEMVEAAFRDHGYPTPRVLLAGSAVGAAEGAWLVKPRYQGGGHGVRRWVPSEAPPDDCYLQEFIRGAPGAVVFVAARGEARPLGVTRQIIGDPAFGASGFQYCGSILSTDRPAPPNGVDVARLASGLASTAASEFGLVGVNGIDFISHGGVPYPIEVNPRWCASMELVERAWGLSVFETHARACMAGTLTDASINSGRKAVPGGTVGKAIVFARQDVTVGDTRVWLETHDQETGADIRDVPWPGERILSGRPVCTVFARGMDDPTCRRALVGLADQVYAQLDLWKDEPAGG